jgi:hypothetical protein
MVKELTDMLAFNQTQKKSFHIIIITIAIASETILSSDIENWSVRVKSVSLHRCVQNTLHALIVIHQTVCCNEEVIKDFEKPQCCSGEKRMAGWKETVSSQRTD